MEQIVFFIITFLVVYLLYYFFSVRKARRNSKKIPVEVEYLILKYQLDTKNFRYKKFLNTIALVGSFDIALVVTVVFQIDGLIWQLLFGFIFLVPVIVFSFMLVGRYYQVHLDDGVEEEIEKEKAEAEKENQKNQNKKGENKNGKHKKNRK